MEEWELRQRQSLPLEAKVRLSELRIRQAHYHFGGNIYVSFSGGKDSTVLLHITRKIFPDVPAVFINTGMEYPEIVDFVKGVENVEWLRPKKTFKEVIDRWGYPIISKDVSGKLSDLRSTKICQRYRDKILHGTGKKKTGKMAMRWRFLIDAPFKISDYCCEVMKKNPAKEYEKRTGRIPMIGTMASDSRLRQMAYLKTGCNAFSAARPISRPLSIWNESDIWEYLKREKVPYSKIYDSGVSRTGCIYCMFGIMHEKTNKFQRLQKSHPHLHNYCINTLGCGKVLKFIGVNPYCEEDLFNKNP